jgi:putative DNA primase/helicase
VSVTDMIVDPFCGGGTMLNPHDAIREFREAMAARGIVPPDEIIADGLIHRCDAEGKGGKGDAAYLLHLDGIPAGGFENWRDGLGWQDWRANVERHLTPSEKAAHQAKIETARHERQKDEAKRHEEAQRICVFAWGKATPCDPENQHQYLKAKGVQAHGLRETPDGRLLIPVRGTDGKLHSLQFIGADGNKRFKTGGRKRGCYFSIGKPNGVLCICEGYATGASIHEATGYAVAVAFDCGNMKPVAEALRAKFPDVKLIICADDDYCTEGNPGLTKATEAAQAVGGLLAIPAFGESRASNDTDFNDMAARYGLAAVRARIDAAGLTEKTSPSSFCEGTEGTGGTASNTKASSGSPDEKHEGTGGTGDYPGEDSRPCYRVYDAWRDDGKRKHRPGVYHHAIRRDKEGGAQLLDEWVCSPCHLLAQSNDGEANYGRVIDFVTSDGHRKRFAVPMQMLAGSGEELRGLLMGLGLEINPKAHKLFGEYLQWRTPKETIRCATQTGWHLTPTGKNAFVLPDAVYGEDGDTVIFQSEAANGEKYREGGTLAGWQALAALAAGNPMMLAAISASLAGAILGPLHADGGGLHFTGDSSIGKTTILFAASSVWGGKEARGSWRSTSNGMEGAAALSNDTALALDEISECDPKEVGAIVYAAANGSGKQRAGRTGAARAVTKWRTFIISTGERSIATAMSEGGYRAKAGQQVRILDIPAARQFGCFDELHGHESGASLSDCIKREADTHHGQAGRAFVEKLARADWHEIAQQYERFKTAPLFNPANADGQVKRAAGRFALIGLAGELAAEWGIVGWRTGEAMEAARLCFDLWRNARGHGEKNDETRQIADAVSRFIERHGDGRFSDLAGNSAATIRDRAGYWKQSGDERIYLFNADGLREATRGFDFGRALDALEAMGAIPRPGADGKRATKTKIDGRAVWLYHITPSRLTEGADHGAD